MPTFKSLTVVALSFFALTACGGGGDPEADIEDEITAPITNDVAAGSTTNPKFSCTGLLPVYDKIRSGMTSNQVKAVAGCKPFSEIVLNGQIYQLSFGSESPVEILGATFSTQKGNTVSVKTYTGSGLTKSDSL